MKHFNLSRYANSIARQNGYGSATLIEFGAVHSPKITKTLSFGYRKRTTGEYVPNAYLQNFGWKNTYYQNSVFELTLPLWMGWLAGEDL